VRAETLGHDAGAELRADLQAAVALDAHAADQILVYAALAGGATSFSTRALSEHARTVIWLLEQFVPKRIAVQEGEGRVQVRIADRS
jgi:RNA 3'-terminal phosphate cyclase